MNHPGVIPARILDRYNQCEFLIHGRAAFLAKSRSSTQEFIYFFSLSFGVTSV